MFSGLDWNGHSVAKQFAWWDQTENRLRGVLGQVIVACHGNVAENSANTLYLLQAQSIVLLYYQIVVTQPKINFFFFNHKWDDS